MAARRRQARWADQAVDHEALAAEHERGLPAPGELEVLTKALPEVKQPGRPPGRDRDRQVARALVWLRGEPWCTSATIFGEAVHAMIDRGVISDQLAAALAGAGLAHVPGGGIACQASGP